MLFKEDLNCYFDSNITIYRFGHNGTDLHSFTITAF